jgi:type IV pilus assembly protein PilY1
VLNQHYKSKNTAVLLHPLKRRENMIQTNQKLQIIILMASALLFLVGGWFSLSHAKDTDIYQVNTKQNCIILIDNSGSMAWGIYEESVDYAAMYDYLFTKKDLPLGDFDDFIYDDVAGMTIYNNGHQKRDKIYIVKGEGANLTLATVVDQAGVDQTVAFTGDPGHPGIIWDVANLVDTNVLIDSDGNLTYDGSGDQRITVDGNGYILFDDQQLPLNKNIKLTDMVALYDGSLVDQGFGGLLNAPGYYFSGYNDVTSGGLVTAADGDPDIYFFVTGNWVDMQAVFNLTYKDNPGSYAAIGDEAWKHETIPLASSGWSEVNHVVRYPDSGNYTNKLAEIDTMQIITHPGAAQIQVHFSAFDVEGDGNASQWNKDYVVIYDGAGNEIVKYDNDNSPGWSATIDDDTVKIALKTNNSDVRTGFIIDKIRASYQPGGYLMQSRLDVAKDALLYVLDEFHGKMNWGYATYKDGNGAAILSDLNPNLTDDANRAAIINHVENTSASGGTPMGEALQDVFEHGYHRGSPALSKLLCRKNYVISLTDGFPSLDTEWDRIPDIVQFSDPTMNDGDGWTADPSQYATPPDNYYDDVGHWMYTHSWIDKTEVADPANSYVNIMTHHIAFGMDHPLLKDAAGESGGLYIAAYNKAQLVAAFYALTLQMTEAVSLTSTVVSVDSANKIQNGDDLYLGLFLPQDNQPWIGNIKKFRLGDGSVDRPNIWMIYDGNDNDAINSSGDFLDNTGAFWADDTDSNDSDNYGSADVREDGVGEVLKERVDADLISTDYWERPIYTYEPANIPNMKKVHKDYITKEELNVIDDLTRDKVINFLYGYTYDADAATNAITGVRDWVLGSVVHSRPVVIDYYDPTDISKLTKRYIVVGANDGMLHFFDDTDPDGAGPQKSSGKEIFAFVPQDLLPKLKLLPDQPFVDMVDGDITLYRSNKNPKYLIFGERIGGSAYWCLDISNTDPLLWSVKWVFSNSEIAQSWSAPIVSTIPVSIDATTGKRTFKDILIFTGGYDPEEDNYPEPFNDIDNSGSPYADTGNMDNSKWIKNNNDQDINDNDAYDFYNPEQNEYGRGIFAIDIEDGSNIIFSATYGATTDVSTSIQTLDSMKFCFPASPSIVSGTYSYIYKESGTVIIDRKSNVLKAIYAIDIYSNLYKVDYSFEIDDDTDNDYSTFGPFSIEDNKWKVTHVFSGNPGSLSVSGSFGTGDDSDAKANGHKAFYPPVVSWGGACNYLDSDNYRFTNTVFSGQNEITSLYFGTGDREHPTYTMIKNRFYAVYDDSSVTAILDPSGTSTDITVTSIPYKEDNLLNLTCNDLDTGSLLTEDAKTVLKEDLRDDPIYAPAAGTLALEDGANENDAKGWYIVFEDQGNGLCSAGYAEDHTGEKMLSKPDLYAGILYFTTYQPAVVDPCNPQGNGFTYALNYCDGTAGYNLNTSNDSVSDHTFDVSDRSIKVTGIFGIPSNFSIVTRKGQAGAMAMMGGKVIGPQGGNIFQIKSPGMGLELYYWRESNSQK